MAQQGFSLYQKFIDLAHFFKIDSSSVATNTVDSSSGSYNFLTRLPSAVVIGVDKHDVKTAEIKSSLSDLEGDIEKFSLRRDHLIQKSLERLRQRSKEALLDASTKAKQKEPKKPETAQSQRPKQTPLSRAIAASPPEEQARLRFKLRPLGKDELGLLRQLFGNSAEGEAVSEFGSFCVTAADMATLLPGRWLNDEVMNFYMGLLQRRADLRDSRRTQSGHHLFFNTFFFASLSGGAVGGYDYGKVRRWTKRKKIDIFALEKVFVPINISNCHWTLAVVDLGERAIFYLDSYASRYDAVFECLQRYLFDEHADKRGPLSDAKRQKLEFERVMVSELPRQKNSYDCGVFVCKAAEFIADQMPLGYSQADMPLLRQRMALEIISQKTDSELFREAREAAK